MEFLSDIELYYTPFVQNDNAALIADEEFKHITKVMRHQAGDEIYFTNGRGKIFKGKILSIQKDNLNSSVEEVYSYEDHFSNAVFCIPKLKNPDRFEFALEKCAELGITKFIIFSSDRSFVKGDKTERWNKILLAAMKQSLRCYLPRIINISTYEELLKLGGEIILFDQNADETITDFYPEKNKNYYFIFGPEGGLTERELRLPENKRIFKLADNRLRSETAVISAAVNISEKIKNPGC